MTLRPQILSGLLLLLALPATADEWRSTDGGSLTFEVAFEGAPLRGEFRRFDVALSFDPADPGSSRLRVTVDLTAADMGDPDMNDVLFDTAWLHVARFGESRFVSDAISASAPGEYIAQGMLELKGTMQPVAVPFTWVAADDTATMTGKLVLKRTDFDVGTGEWATGDTIGIDVSLAFEVRLRRCE